MKKAQIISVIGWLVSMLGLALTFYGPKYIGEVVIISGIGVTFFGVGIGILNFVKK